MKPIYRIVKRDEIYIIQRWRLEANGWVDTPHNYIFLSDAQRRIELLRSPPPHLEKVM